MEVFLQQQQTSRTCHTSSGDAEISELGKVDVEHVEQALMRQ